jgi:serine/threonine protein kinase
MPIMEYADKGNLRECLTEITNSWNQKLFLLYCIINGLDYIHNKNLIHYDFHDGNILYDKFDDSIFGYISDYLETYQLAKSFLKKDDIYGVIPFMAPEVLKGKPYTQASNIYSFSMIMWEFTSKIPPFSDKAHDIQLALSICKGERPKIIENTPQCYIDLMKKCWDEDPLKRLSASEILDIIKSWIFPLDDTEIENINEKLKNNIMEFINAPTGCNNPITEFHSQAYYKSKLLDFTSKELNEVIEDSLELKLKQEQKNTEQKLLNLEIYFKNELQDLKDIQIKEFTYLQNEKQILANNLAKQLEQNKLANDQISQLKQEKNNLQEKLIQIEANIQELKSQQDQYKNQLSQDNQNLKLNLDIQIKLTENLQTQITFLQNEKQIITNNLAKQLEQNKLNNEQISQLKQEKNNLQEKFIQTETNIQELKSQQDQYKNQLSQNYKQIENKNLKLENELKENQVVCQNIQMELNNLQQRNSQLFEQNNQELRLDLAMQIKEFAEKENNLQKQIIYLQSRKQALTSSLIKQLEENKLANQQESLIEQKKQLENKLSQSQVNY